MKPGLLESAYQSVMAYEMELAGLAVEKKKILPVNYKNVTLEFGFRGDFLAERLVMVDSKAIQDLTSVDTAQLLNYLRLTSLPIGLVINFNVPKPGDGIRRIANDSLSQTL